MKMRLSRILSLITVRHHHQAQDTTPHHFTRLSFGLRVDWRK